MKTVRLHHPGSGGEFDAPESSLPHHLAAGWERVVQEPPRVRIRKSRESQADSESKETT